MQLKCTDFIKSKDSAMIENTDVLSTCNIYDRCCIIVGVQMNAGGDNLGQQYTSPEKAIQSHGADIIIVGRGITKCTDPVATAQQYQIAGYKAYQELL